MVGNKTTRRTRKPIETTLGKAPVKPKEKVVDISALRQPIETSVRGAREIAALLKTGTDEVKGLISYECDLMYECRFCKSIFRCLSNFVLHKRKYCVEKYNPACYVDNDETQIVEPSQEPAAKISQLDKIIEKLSEIERVSEAAKESLKERNVNEHEDEASRFSHIVLEKIDSNNSGIFQTLVNGTTNKPKELTKTQVMENYKKLDNDVPILDPEGKICGFTSNKLYTQSLFPKFNFPCYECNQKFATRKSLNNHMKYIHNPSKMLYFCPVCKETLANPWSVYRHLLRVHKMVNKQVRRMRDQVTNSSVLRKDEDSIKTKKRAEPTPIINDSEKQWINDIEGDKDFQMCGGCGKRFERKAALHAHSQMCTKRMEVCNNIAKKKEEKVEKTKLNKPIEIKKITGALKRKRPTIYSCPRKRTILVENIDDEISTEIKVNLNQLENNNVASSPILDDVIVEATTDIITAVTDEIQEVLTESVNNNFPAAITKHILAKDRTEVPLSSKINNLSEIEQIDYPQIIPLSNVETIFLDHSPENCEDKSSSSDNCDSSEDDVEIIELTDDPVADFGLLSRGVSFEAFCQQVDMTSPNENHLLDNLPVTDNDVIFIEEEEINDNDIVEEIVDSMELKPDVKICNYPNEQKTKENIQQDDDYQKNYLGKPNAQEADQQKQQANDTDKPIIIQQADPMKQNQQISQTDELNIKATEEQAGTKTTTSEEEDMLKKKNMFPQCALPYIVPLELLCIPCDRKFSSIGELHCHMSGHFSWFRFQCTKCSFVSFKKEDCLIHAEERHNLEHNAVLRCIVPIPYWRAERISHSYKPMKDRDAVVGGTYTDEEIGDEEIIEPIIGESLESVAKEMNSLFFGSLFLKENTIIDKESETKNTLLAQSVIDIEETVDDDQLLPEPIEMECPVDCTTDLLGLDEEIDAKILNKSDKEGNDSSDDWELPEVIEARKIVKKRVAVKKTIPEPVPIVRAVRMRTKVKKNEDFLYYDSSTSLNELTRMAKVPMIPKKKREK